MPNRGDIGECPYSILPKSLLFPPFKSIDRGEDFAVFDDEATAPAKITGGRAVFLGEEDDGLRNSSCDDLCIWLKAGHWHWPDAWPTAIVISSRCVRALFSIQSHSFQR